MNKSQIEQQVIDILKKKLFIDDITIESNLHSGLGADSLDFMESIMEFENHFKITIPETESIKFETVADICNYIETVIPA